MAIYKFKTNQTLVDRGFNQTSGGTLTLSGNNLISVTATLRYVNDASGSYVARSVVDAEFVTGITSAIIDTIEGQYVTGATNGLSKDGVHDIKLGGTLTENTIISGASQDLSLGTAGNELAEFSINATGNLLMSVSGGTITTSDLEGLRYTANYSTSFVERSLVDKAYVDTIATGLHPHDVVLVATTGETLSLSGLTTIDGVAVTADDRVLVKDQTSGETNGVYVVAAGAWTRAVDFDGAPDGEVVNGDLIPVESGDTHANTIWVLTTPDPITVGTTALNFTLFSRLLGVSGGDGIEITPNGSTQQIAVDLVDTGSGLVFSGGDLTINSSIAGSGLTWNSGVLDVNADGTTTGNELGIGINAGDSLVLGSAQITNDNLVAAGGSTISGTEITLKYNGNNELVVDSDNVASSIATTTPSGTLISVYDNSGELVIQESDIQSAQSGYTFTNGITETNGTVKLGGILSETTTIDGSQTLRLVNNLEVTGTTDITGTVTLDSVAAGSTTDNVLTITTGGEVQKISVDSLGEDNNIYAMTIVTTDVTLTTGSTYVQLVSGATSGLTITLPASPIDGQVFRIKDAANTALQYSITVAGNGNNIDNSSTSASLNTDGGALELVYNNALGSWYVFSFVN